MSDIEQVLNLIKEQDVRYVDFRFTDCLGVWHHMAYHTSMIEEALLREGVFFDGSSIKGWRSIHESDMKLAPDLSTATMDPFASQPTLVLICNIIEPLSGSLYLRDPRTIAKRAEGYLKSSSIADTAYFGPEIEFFLFDSARFEVSSHRGYYHLEAEELPSSSGKKFSTLGGSRNTGHRPRTKEGYMPCAPLDSGSDIRAEMLTTLEMMGVSVEKHHHEVAPGQHELGIRFSTLVKAADNVQLYKYVVRNVAHTYGKTATFMPKPILGDNGSGMHVHQSLWQEETPLFKGTGCQGLSELALYYIGGILYHAKAINAFTNPTTNSYKRLIPGFEAPVVLTYSASNRSASCRIPLGGDEKGKRIEIRFPDPTANPYLGFSALLMAGLDGIENKIHPGEALDHNLYELKGLDKIPVVCASLEEALGALDKDRSFLTKGGVFSDDHIDAYIALKQMEAIEINRTPHPLEFAMYYSS